ncbi:MAG: enoyl-CoA hydratase-related protein [bacterium]
MSRTGKETASSLPPGTAVIRLPATPGSVMTREQLEGVGDALEAAASEGPRLLLLTGTPAGHFGRGLSTEALRRPGGREEGYLIPLQAASVPLVHRLLTFPAPTAAVIEGPALGAHLTLALLCDVRGAVPGERTLMGYPEVGLGMLPALGGIPCLARVTGPVRAAELLVSGRRVEAADALRLGLVDTLLGEETPESEMAEWMEANRRRAGRRRRKPRRYPQGKTWADLLLEGTRFGRRWLFRRLARRLEGIVRDEVLRTALLGELRLGMEEDPEEAAAAAREEAAECALREPADNALSVLTMREWAGKGEARWDIPQDAARKLQGTWYREGLTLLLDGMKTEDVDAAAREAGMGPGPCRLMDRDGMGEVVPLVREAMERLPDPAVDPAVEALSAGLLEREMGGGQRFYRYGGRRPEPVQPIYHLVDRVRGEREMDRPRPGRREAADRLVLALVTEASRGIDEDHPAWVWDLTAITVLEWAAAGAGPLRRSERSEGRLLQRAPELAERWGVRLEAAGPREGKRWFPDWPLTSPGPEEPQTSSPR